MHFSCYRCCCRRTSTSEPRADVPTSKENIGRVGQRTAETTGAGAAATPSSPAVPAVRRREGGRVGSPRLLGFLLRPVLRGRKSTVVLADRLEDEIR